MNILVMGEQIRFDELKLKLGNGHYYYFLPFGQVVETIKQKKIDCVIDLNFDDDANNFANALLMFPTAPKMVCGVKKTLSQFFFEFQDYDFDQQAKSTVVGVNFLPTFINKPLTEASSLGNVINKQTLDWFENHLGLAFELVGERVGMVVPRVVCMLINEGFFALQERTATQADIDKSMKLGTNYPFGVFEWSERIGIKNVYETLLSVYEDTQDERYKICPLLKKTHLQTI